MSKWYNKTRRAREKRIPSTMADQFQHGDLQGGICREADGGHVLVTEFRGMALNGLFCADVLQATWSRPPHWLYLQNANLVISTEPSGWRQSIGRAASDEVILQLVFSKCIPVLLNGLESMSLTRSDEKSLDFTFNRFMMKLFGTTDCQVYFGTQPPSEILNKTSL